MWLPDAPAIASSVAATATVMLIVKRLRCRSARRSRFFTLDIAAPWGVELDCYREAEPAGHDSAVLLAPQLRPPPGRRPGHDVRPHGAEPGLGAARAVVLA